MIKTFDLNEKLSWKIASFYKLEESVFISSESGVLKLDLNQLSLKKLEGSKERINSTVNFNGLVLAGGKKGIFSIGRTASILNTDQPRLNSIKTTIPEEVYALYNEDNKYLWVGTYLDGIYVLDQNLEIVNHLQSTDFDGATLPSNNVFSMLGDRFGGLWISTDVGLAYMRSEYRHWKHVWPSTNETGLQGKSISDIAENQRGDVLVGTYSGHLTLFDSELNLIRSKLLENGSDANAVYKILKTDRNSWLISDHKGLNEYGDDLNLKINPVFQALNESYENAVLVFDLVVTKDAYWLATYQNGLLKLGKDKSISTFNLENLSLGDSINGLFLDSKSQLWVLTLSGLYKVNLSDDSIERIEVNIDTASDSAADSPESLINRFTVMSQDSKGNYWIGTEGYGILKYIPKENRFFQFDESKGLSNNQIVGIVTEGSNVWASTNSGLNLIHSDTGEIRQFFYNDGLQDDEFNLTAYLKHANGDLYFGGVNGFNRIKAQSLPPEIIAPVVTASFINPVSDQRINFSSHQEKKEALQFTYNDLPIQLDISAIHSKFGKENKVYYRSNEISNWQVYSGKGSIQFGKGSSGEHSIEIRSDALGDEGTATSLNLSFSIGYPWWRSNLAYISYFVAAFIVLFLAYKVRVRSLKRRAAELENTVTIRTAEIAEQKSTIESQYQQLEKLTNEKTRFFENLSHEFRTPLTLITGPVKRMLKSANKSDKQQLGIVARNAERLLNLIEQLLEISRLNSGIRKAKPVTINLNVFVEELITEFDSVDSQTPINFSNKIPANFNISFDHESLQRILINLTSNAVKYNKPHGSVEFYIDDEGCGPHSTKLIIADTGIGIGREELANVFNRFSRFENNQKIAGTGLGLALVKELVTLNKSSIEVESKLGVGTQFSITLRKADSFVSEKSTFDASLMDSVDSHNIQVETNKDKVFEDKGKLLVVDDDADMLNFVSSCLTQYQCITAANGKEAFDLALEAVPDVIVTDAMMPIMDGFELSKSIKGHPVTNHIPILILTARGSRYSRIEGLQTGADDYLSKPFDEDELVQRVDNLLENRKTLREKYTDSILSSKNEQLGDEKHNQFIQSLEMILDKNHASPEFSVKSLSTSLSMSDRQLQRKVKAVLGLSPSEAIRVYRLNRAKKKLLNGEQVSQVCYSVGFNSLPHFSREFKEHFNIPPSKVS